MTIRLLTILTLFIAVPLMALAAGGDAPAPAKQDWSFNGWNGTYDRAALQRGFKIHRNVCSSCHSMKLLHYRNLEALGYDENQVKSIAAEYTVIDGPDDEGEMFERPARPSDRFVLPFENEAQAKAANGGAYPPDFSLISKARKGGADYIYALLTGYEDAPHDAHIMDGQYWNKYMGGNIIAMAPPLSDGIVAYEDGSPEIVSQYAKDVSEFLTWASDPHMEERKRMGVKVLLFLLVFASVMYAYKRKIWSDVH